VGVTSFGEDVGKLEDTLEALAIPRRLPSSPPQAKGLKPREWVDCQEVGFMLSDAELVADTQASNGAAARMRGDTDTWGIQVKLQMLLPETGKWDLYAAVRIDKGEGPDSAPAVLVGVSPGPYKTLTVGQLADERYHVVKLPGGPYTYNATQDVWLAPPNSKAIKYMYVDRIFAVKVE
jgi:hypothetical protein